MKKIFPKINSNIIYKSTSTISRGETCSLCNKSLDSNQVQYLCITCDPDIYFCENCYKQEKPGVGSAKLVHPHHLIRIGPESQALDEIFIGRDCFGPGKFYEYEPDRCHDANCDNQGDFVSGCQGEINGIRYNCLNCVDWDYCEKCFVIWINSPHKSMIEKANRKGHFHSHAWAVIHYP